MILNEIILVSYILSVHILIGHGREKVWTDYFMLTDKIRLIMEATIMILENINAQHIQVSLAKFAKKRVTYIEGKRK